MLLNKPRDRPACQTASRFDGTDVQGVDAVVWLVAHRLTGGGCRAGRSAGDLSAAARECPALARRV